ncbi:hypothetical protein STCU_11743 [Strigomonas culicis]|uniref:Uncharacterized protein n=1 Tax=Strigomonas culicis TaxID=28005 RepID=S9UM89_9TRYP|nr:hypothetical protein STCU_11743 [Strigomonas culicis]|eukprot:EPY15821.1 hypothetical protein STCU_11743 [Strigomonas culicis]
MSEVNTPKFPRVPHSTWARGLIWLNGVSLLVCGAIAFVLNCMTFSGISHVFVCLYWVLFGVITILVELRLPFAERFFGFSCTKCGQAVFFIFAGTLGVSLGIGLTAAKLIPFIAGIASVAIGAACYTDAVITDKVSTSRNTVTVETVV